MIRTSPTSGTKVSQGSTVTLYVSSGLPNVSVPNVAGFSQSQAGSAIGGAGLVVGSNPTQQPSTQYPSGDVISTTPPAGHLGGPGYGGQPDHLLGDSAHHDHHDHDASLDHDHHDHAQLVHDDDGQAEESLSRGTGAPGPAGGGLRLSAGRRRPGSWTGGSDRSG